MDGGNQPAQDMQTLNKQERRELKRKLREEKRQREQKERSSTGKRRLIITAALVILVVIAGGYLTGLLVSKPSPYTAFAKCLSGGGAVIYGNDWCEYTQEQMAMFGNSFAQLKYIKCDDNKGLCGQKGVKITPTWEIDGKTYQGVQTFQKLSELSGCKI